MYLSMVLPAKKNIFLDLVEFTVLWENMNEKNKGTVS